MNANEVRLGNLVFVDGKVTHIRWYDLEYCDPGDDLGGYKPIPLTPEILEKAGFNYQTEMDRYYIMLASPDKHLEFDFLGDGWYIWMVQSPELSFQTEEMISLNKINYLHQLQNLYFALTGEELTINL